MVDTRGGIVIEPPAPPATCYACGGEITLTDEMRDELRRAPGARLRHETCPSAVPVPSTLRHYRVTTVFTRLDSDPNDDPLDLPTEPVETVLMQMAHDVEAADLASAWDDLCIGIVSKYNQASMHTGIAEAPEPEEEP